MKNSKMKKSDWIILRLIMQCEYLEHGLDGDALNATEYLFKKYDRKYLGNCIEKLKKDEDYQKYILFKLAENFLKEKA